MRPQAYLELARIRLAGAKATRGPDGKLSPARFAEVMALLRRSFAQSDQQEKYYELLVELWQNASGKPEKSELASLAACARIFTRRSDLTLRSAQLHAAFGYADEARGLSETALLFARDEELRAKLVELKNGNLR